MMIPVGATGAGEKSARARCLFEAETSLYRPCPGQPEVVLYYLDTGGQGGTIPQESPASGYAQQPIRVDRGSGDGAFGR
jgi:hypothetical protein